MLNSILSGKTVVLTGTSKTTTVLTQLQDLGADAYSYPLINTRELIEPDDYIQLEMAKNYDWLIFTSQNAVTAFCHKLKRHNLEPSDFIGKIAAVGRKTATMLEENKFTVSFIPTIFSADVFIKEFPKIAGETPRCMFIRGKLAKDTLKDGLPFLIDEWNVYDTHEQLTNARPLIELIQNRKLPIIIFASPSAVYVYANYIAPIVGWKSASYAAIGHITESAINEYGAEVTYKPKTYTMQAVLDEIVKREEA